jgi:hypothetical protein
LTNQRNKARAGRPGIRRILSGEEHADERLMWNYPAVEHFINKTLTPRFSAFALSLLKLLTLKMSQNKILGP